MENISVVLPRNLSEKLRKKVEEADLLPEELVVEAMLKGLGEELDPRRFVEHYQALSDRYLGNAKEFLNKGDLLQASERLWGAVALAVKMVAAMRGLKLEEHGSLWSFVSRLSKEQRDKELVTLFSAANGLHRNFYENQMNRESLEIIIEDIERLITKLKGIQ